MNQTSNIPLVSDEDLYPALIQCFFIISAGYIAGQLNLLTNTHSIGLSRYISNFALPAIIFKNLVDVQFQSVSWQFLTAVLIGKTIIFFLTMILTFIAERPRNFANMGEYAIMTTQSNDFPLIYPIIESVYKQTHPEFGRYVYLIAPIQLVILNPIGFFFIELQKRFDEQQKHRGKSWNKFQLISTVFRNISRNPIVICTLLGVIFNLLLKQHLPYLIEYVLTPIAQSFSATALFYLGLTMVGKLNRLHAHLVITVFLLSMMKSIIFPLILRQLVFFLVKPENENLNYTLDYSNLGFLYGTAPTAPSVVFYVPESNLPLQAIASTGLVVSTLLSGPIILVSAKMINLRTLDIKIRESYEILLMKTKYDVSIMSLCCTIIVLIGFCLRHRWLKISFIHKYTLIFVGLQIILAIWTIVIHHVKGSLLSTTSPLLDIGSILIALTTRTWATSLSIALMITICYSNQLARRYSWIYHVFGWTVSLCISLIILFCSSSDRSKEASILETEKFGKIQIILSTVLLVICILINTISLLRIARRTFRLKHDSINNRSHNNIDHSNSGTNEIRPLIDDDDEQTDIRPIIPAEIKPSEADTQLFRHGILVALLTIDAIICVSVLLWLILAHDRNGIYYELQFLDTVLLHGQGIITFLVFALDADLLVPITQKIIKLFHHCGFNINCCRDDVNTRSIENNDSLDLENRIRPDFIRQSNMNSPTETIFNGNQFCQWIITNGYVENEYMAQNYFQQLLDHKQAYIKKPNLKVIHCLSNKCDNCLNEYFEKNLQLSYNQRFQNHKDTLEMGRPNAVVTSPNITINDDQMMHMQDDAIKKLKNEKKEIRKRYALMQMNDSVFILGGYIVDAKTGQKKAPENDYLYSNNTKELIELPPIPGNGRMGFGLAATDDSKIISVGGHNFNYETMSNVNMLDTKLDKFEWRNLPYMPNGSIGPGVSVIDNVLYVIGGFDFIGNEIVCNGDVLLMDLEKKQWKTLADLDPPRARPLISIIDNKDSPTLIVAGGYNFDEKGKAVPYGKIEEYDMEKKKWKVVVDIPDFKTSNGLATKNNKLYLMDSTNETGENQIIKEYNLLTRKWESSHDIKQSKDRHNVKNQANIKNEESDPNEDGKN
ncbi:unnamed protein product [Rotaria sp. Silwood1]|nr:unnamed protein product [Rotaria sp. Silwood1]